MMRRLLLLWSVVAVVAVCLGWIDPRQQLGPSSALGPGRPGPLSTAHTVVETVTVMLTTNFGITPGTHIHDDFDTDYAAVDSVVDLQAVTSDFAYVTLDEATGNTGSYSFNVGGSAYLIREDMKSAAAGGVDAWPLDAAGRRHLLVYYDFLDLIPRNCQIVSAEIKAVQPNSTMYVDKPDSLVVTLMSRPTDNVWYTSKGTDYGTYDLPNLSHATWDNAIQALGVNDYPSSGTTAWGVSWDDREHYWDEGNYSDWCSAPSFITQPPYTQWSIPFINCLQAIVNGETNNGLLMHYKDDYAAASNFLMFTGWESVSGHAVRRPYMLVKYITRSYRAPMPKGSDIAFIMTCYDGTRPQLFAYDALFQEFGAAFTAYVPGAQTYAGKSYLAGPGDPFLDEGTQKRVDLQDLLTLHDNGHEIASHSFIQNGTVNGRIAQGQTGALFWEVAGDSIDAVDGAGAWKDSLAVDVSRDWMIDGVLDSTGVDLSASERFAKCFSPPSGQFGPYVINACVDAGWKFLRSSLAEVANWNGVYDYFYEPAFRPADCDTFREGYPANDPMAPRNIMAGSMSFEIDHVVGDKTATPTEAEVKENFKRVLHQLRGQRRGVMSTDVHDVKTGIVSYDSYDDRADTNEVRWMLEVLEELRVPVITDSELARWYRDNGTPMPTPTAYAQDDSFKFRMDDDVWYMPDGRDGTIIPGLKNTEGIPPDYPLDIDAFGINGTDWDAGYYAFINWTANTEEDLDHYEIYRSQDVDTDPFWKLSDTDNPWHFDYSLKADTTYYYHVIAVDTDGNKSSPTANVSATPPAGDLYFPVDIIESDFINTIDASGDSLRIEVPITLTKEADVKMVSWWNGNEAESWHKAEPADTTAATHPSFIWHDMGGNENDITFDTQIPSPIARSDSTVHLDWTFTNPESYDPWPEPPDVIILERSHNYGPFEEVTHSLTGTDSTFSHGPDGDPSYVPVRRGIEYYRIMGIRGSYDNRQLTTDWDYLESPYYNQAVEVYFEIHASDGTTMAAGNQVVGMFTHEYSGPVDVVAPVASFTEAVFDTTDAGNVILVTKGSSSEAATGWWQWKEAYDDDWWPETPKWIGRYASASDSATVFTLRDTTHTEISTADMDSVHVRFYAKDKDQNVGDPVYGGSFKFVRKTAARYPGYTIISNSAAVDSTTCDNWVTAGASISFNCWTKDTLSVDTNWGRATENEPMNVHYIASEDRLLVAPNIRNYRLPVLEFSSSALFDDAKVDSAKLWIYTRNRAPSNADSLIVWGMNNTDFKNWDQDDASFAMKDASKGTRWTATDVNADGYYNMFDLCGFTGDCETSLGGVSVAVSTAEYGTETYSWNSALDVTRIVQDHIDNGAFLKFGLFPKVAIDRPVVWTFSNEASPDASYRPRLEVWVSEDN